jgi:hypothetical protein
VRLIIWVPIGLVLFVSITGVVFAPVLQHLQTYWWVYLLAIPTIVAVIVYFAIKNASHVSEATAATSRSPHSPSQAQHAASQVNARIAQEQVFRGRPTSGLALFRFTEEWITRNGLYEGRDMSKTDAVKIAGRTAISYHLREGNFIERNGKIALSAKGKSHFEIRRTRL